MLPGIKRRLKIMNLCIAAPLMSAMNNKHDMGLDHAMDVTTVIGVTRRRKIPKVGRPGHINPS